MSRFPAGNCQQSRAWCLLQRRPHMAKRLVYKDMGLASNISREGDNWEKQQCYVWASTGCCSLELKVELVWSSQSRSLWQMMHNCIEALSVDTLRFFWISVFSWICKYEIVVHLKILFSFQTNSFANLSVTRITWDLVVVYSYWK